MTIEIHRTIRNCFLLAAFACLAVTGHAAGAPDATIGYIVQGPDLDSVRAAVETTGGDITHELGIISAVRAELTADQRERLERFADLRLYEDRATEVAGKGSKSKKASDLEEVETQAAISQSAIADARECDVPGAGNLEFNKNRVKWNVSNDSGAGRVIVAVSATWPGTNDKLKKLKLKDKEFFGGSVAPPYGTVVADEMESEGTRTLTKGSTRDVMFEFHEDADDLEHKYSFLVRFDDGSCAAYNPEGAGGGNNTIVRDTYFPTQVGAADLHRAGVDGSGVTIAVIDTGLWKGGPGVAENARGESRILAHYDAIEDLFEGDSAKDKNGHGTHVWSVALSSLPSRGADGTPDGSYNGIAPNADIVSVKAFNEFGYGTYADVIRGLDFVVANKDTYGIRVLNLSFSAPPQSHYWDDPVNQAVMAAWRAGIVVVASAGNTGPEPMTIGVPGNLPYVITVGAMTDGYTPTDFSDDTMASFSSSGPTAEAFVKPDIVAPGGHLMGIMDFSDTLPKQYPQFHDGYMYFTMSGTSQSAAVVSGAAALLLQADPTLSPDDVKCRLMATAEPAVSADGNLAFSVLRQGAGLVDVGRALESSHSGCANRGLDIARDLSGAEHYAGRARQADDGSFYLEGLDGHGWDGSTVGGDAFMWGDGFMWADAFMWGDGFMWADAFMWPDGFMWTDGFMWADGFMWTDTQTASVGVNVWVDQE